MSQNGVYADSESADTVDLEDAPLVKTSASLEDDNLSSPPPLPSRSVKIAVCLSHALSAWSERTWAFAVGLIFLAIYPDSLFFVSLFGLVQALASVVMSPSVGVYLDSTPRFKAVCVFYFIQNLGLVLSAMASLVLLSRQTHPTGPVGTLAAVGVVASGVLSRTGTMGGTIAIERDWTKALMGSNSQELAKINSTLKMIDLICLIVAPIMSGFLMSFGSMKLAVVQVLFYNLLAWFPEVVLLKYAVSRAPQLRMKAKVAPDDSTEPVENVWKRLWKYLRSLGEGFRLFFRQSCVLACLSLAVLHLTVLSFGILMTAYVKWLGLSEAALSVYRGFGALTGVIGARVFPLFQSRFGLRTSGLISITFFLTCICLGALPDISSLFLPISTTIRFNLLVWAIAISRFGLWVFDLSVSQIVQEWVDESELGRVSAIQKLLENVFTVCIFGAGLVASEPEDFVWLMIISVAAVCSSFVFFLFFLMKSRHVVTTEPQEIEMVQEE